MEQSPYQTPVQSFCVSGPAATGKTQWIVERVASLLSAGESPANIAVFAATPDACDTLAARIAAKVGEAKRPAVVTAFEHEMSLLGTEQAQAATGRKPRVMLRYEENIFLEDMKTSGVLPRRLAEMLKFFYRSCADLENMDYGWFYNDEEEDTFALLNQLLDYYGCYIKPMVCASAWQYASQHAGSFEQLRFDHVLVDDYPLLSRASQCLMGRLARKSLAVAGDPLAQAAVFEEYPAYDGLERFAQANPGCEVIELAQCHAARAVADTLSALLSDEAMAASALECAAKAEGASSVRCFGRPQDELAGITELVESIAEENIAYDAIAIATPSPVWQRNICNALVAQNIPVASTKRRNVAGDVRTYEHSFEGRIVSVLRLMADPSDQMALRCWCGFGDYLANSALFTDLAKADVHLEMGTTEIIATTEQPVLFEQQRDHVLDALEQLREIVEDVHRLSGRELVRAIAQKLDEDQAAKIREDAGYDPMDLAKFGQVSPSMAAAQLVDGLDRVVFLPRKEGQGVYVGSLEDMAGQAAEAMLLAGYSNGLIPNNRFFDPTQVERDRREPLLAAEIARTYLAAGKARRRLDFTYFDEARLAEAERLRLKSERVRLIKGERVCEIHPSEAIRSLTGIRFNG